MSPCQKPGRISYDTRKSEIGSHWISFNALEGWRCFLHRRCGSVGWVGGFHQPASVKGGVDKTLESWTMQTTRIRRTPVPRLSIQCVDAFWSKYIYFFDVHQYCSQQGWTWITSNITDIYIYKDRKLDKKITQTNSPTSQEVGWNLSPPSP